MLYQLSHHITSCTVHCRIEIRSLKRFVQNCRAAFKEREQKPEIVQQNKNLEQVLVSNNIQHF